MRLLLALVLSLFLLPDTASSAAPAAGRDCFNIVNWRGWSAPRDGGALYLRMQGDDVFRVELSPGVRIRRNAGEFLVSQVRGSRWICSALDLDLAIADNNGFSRPLIATGLRKLTPEEVAAIPPEDMPR